MMAYFLLKDDQERVKWRLLGSGPGVARPAVWG